MQDHVYPIPSPELSRHRRELAPEIDRAFHEFSKAAFADGALPRKMKQLIAVAVAHTTQCPYCIRGHTLGALRDGASGFLVKDTEPAELVHAVRVVAAGEALLSPTVTKRLIAEFATYRRPADPARDLAVLTDREREVVGLVASGETNDEIATRLFLSPATVKTHVGRAMTKLGARDRAQLVVLAYESGWARPGWVS
jgi:AhpD family alkylhydroperoxidase